MNITTTVKTKSESHLQAGVRVLNGVVEKRSSENVQVLDPGLEECGNGYLTKVVQASSFIIILVITISIFLHIECGLLKC